MPLIERDIKDVLHFRTDLSPFLVHLTRGRNGKSAKKVLMKIIEEKKLKCSGDNISDARFGMDDRQLEIEKRKHLLSAICFTETPLNEIHCLLKIKRTVDLKPYGLVFLKEQLIKKNVSPVFYISHTEPGRSNVLKALCSLKEKFPDEAKHILPLIAIFGKKVTSPNANSTQTDPIDFSWEREWRRPYVYNDLDFMNNDVFVGLCPDNEIVEFEKIFEPVQFVDPMRNIKFYATKLVNARKRLKLECSVV